MDIPGAATDETGCMTAPLTERATSDLATAPLTVRIVDDRLHLCGLTHELLPQPADDAPVDLGAVRPVPVLLDDGTTSRWYGAPVVGALRP